MDYVGLPLDDKYLDNISEYTNGCKIDPNRLNFEGVDDQILASIIYTRNLQIPFEFDFTKCDYETKEKWILTYLTADLMLDPGIIQLDESVLSILSNKKVLSKCILSDEEIEVFKNHNPNIIEEIIIFLISLNEITMILEKNKDNESIDYNFYKGKLIKEKPYFYETIKHILFGYPIECDAIRLYFTEKYNHVLYEYIIKNISKESGFYNVILSLPSVKFFALI